MGYQESIIRQGGEYNPDEFYVFPSEMEEDWYRFTDEDGVLDPATEDEVDAFDEIFGRYAVSDLSDLTIYIKTED
jgi:hypothetical protein